MDNFESAIKFFGELNKTIYGVNPYDRTQDKIDLERAEDLEELKKDEFYDR